MKQDPYEEKQTKNTPQRFLDSVRTGWKQFTKGNQEAEKETQKQRFDQRRSVSAQIKQQILSGSCEQIPDDMLQEAGIAISEYGYYTAILHMWGDWLEKDIARQALERELTCFNCEKTIHDLSQGKLLAAVTYVNEDYCAILSLMTPDLPEENLYDLFEQMALLFENEYKHRTTVMLSNRVDDATRIAFAYNEVCQLYKYVRTVDSERSVLIKSDLKSDPRTLLKGSFIKQLQILEETILQGCYEKIPGLTQTLLADHVSGLKGHHGMADARLRTISGILIEAVLALELDDTFECSAVEMLLHADTVSGLDAAAEEVFSDIAETYAPSAPTDIVSSGCQFISDHLSDYNLGVPEISAATGVSAQYLSRVFKKKMGITIVEYVNRCRMDYAKRLLREGKATVQSIAEQCGYNNTVTFTRNFKRYIGMTPTEYRTMDA
ncbi:MAG: AraC family transcriptional regulator [Lachnospiraceae bacterium]|nr:AraC family transcriptional regulator [Lachnospiraceae bacterium]